MGDQVITKYVYNAEDVPQEVAEALVKGLESLGLKDPDESVITEHAKILPCDNGRLEYYWDDIMLFATEPLVTSNGLAIIPGEK